MGQQMNYEHWQGEADKGTVVLQDDLNEVHIPKRLKGALQNHYYGTAIDPRTNLVTKAYLPITYEHQEFPKMLYHPEYGQKTKPTVQQYAAGCTTPEQFEAAHDRFRQALAKWERGNRSKLVADAKEEKRLLTKGWLPKLPTPPVAPGSVDDDEL